MRRINVRGASLALVLAALLASASPSQAQDHDIVDRQGDASILGIGRGPYAASSDILWADAEFRDVDDAIVLSVRSAQAADNQIVWRYLVGARDISVEIRAYRGVVDFSTTWGDNDGPRRCLGCTMSYGETSTIEIPAEALEALITAAGEPTDYKDGSEIRSLGVTLFSNAVEPNPGFLHITDDASTPLATL